jgi:hypothetical protein
VRVQKDPSQGVGCRGRNGCWASLEKSQGRSEIERPLDTGARGKGMKMRESRRDLSAKSNSRSLHTGRRNLDERGKSH